MLREPEYAGKAIRVLGFSTVGAPADVAQRVSLKRAAAVRAALLAAGRGSLAADRVVAKGYGTLAPVACPGQAATDYLNRRVEVWLHD